MRNKWLIIKTFNPDSIWKDNICFEVKSSAKESKETIAMKKQNRRRERKKIQKIKQSDFVHSNRIIPYKRIQLISLKHGNGFHLRFSRDSLWCFTAFCRSDSLKDCLIFFDVLHIQLGTDLTFCLKKKMTRCSMAKYNPIFHSWLLIKSDQLIKFISL